MKINYGDSQIKDLFECLSPGQVFIHENELLMKTDEKDPNEPGKVRCVRVKDGHMISLGKIDSNFYIERVDAEIKIK